MPISYQDFLKNNQVSIKPYALMDLDDTLFQTKRKLSPIDDNDDALIIASVNKKGEPLSFFTQKQAHFFQWLNHHTTLIPVTARDRAEIQRVELPFNSIQVLTHGAVIIENGNVNQKWEVTLFSKLFHYQTALNTLYDKLSTLNTPINITPHFDVFCDSNLMIYLAIKHTNKDHDDLLSFANDLPSLFKDWGIDFDGFYVHCNANNLAILPNCVHKKNAVAFLKANYFKDNVPLFGFGDSLADLPFLTLLDWYGTPNKGQLHQYFNKG